MPQPQSLLVVALELVFLGIGVAFLGNAVWNVLAGVKSRAWPSTRGTTTAAELEAKTDSDGTTYRARVAYTYKVQGRDYSSGRVFFGDWMATNLSRSAATRRVMKYRSGSTVTVFYDPARPSRAVLETGINPQTWLEIAFGLLFAVCALFFLGRG